MEIKKILLDSKPSSKPLSQLVGHETLFALPRVTDATI
jgi:hypothetical protein